MICSWLQVVMELQRELPAEFQLHMWKASLHEQKPYTDDFRSFQQAVGSPEGPLDWEHLPAYPAKQDGSSCVMDQRQFDRWKQLLEKADSALLSPQVYKSDWFGRSPSCGLNSRSLPVLQVVKQIGKS